MLRRAEFPAKNLQQHPTPGLPRLPICQDTRQRDETARHGKRADKPVGFQQTRWQVGLYKRYLSPLSVVSGAYDRGLHARCNLPCACSATARHLKTGIQPL